VRDQEIVWSRRDSHALTDWEEIMNVTLLILQFDAIQKCRYRNKTIIKGGGGEESCRLADSETVWLAAYAHFQAGLANITSVGMSSVKFIHHQTVHHSHGHLGCNLLRHTHINTQFYSASFILVDRLRNLKKDYAYLPSKFWAGARHFMLVHYQRADDFLLVSS